MIGSPAIAHALTRGQPEDKVDSGERKARRFLTPTPHYCASTPCTASTPGGDWLAVVVFLVAFTFGGHLMCPSCAVAPRPQKLEGMKFSSLPLTASRRHPSDWLPLFSADDSMWKQDLPEPEHQSIDAMRKASPGSARAVLSVWKRRFGGQTDKPLRGSSHPKSV